MGIKLNDENGNIPMDTRSLLKLPESSQNKIIESASMSKNGGWFGNIFGHAESNAALHISFVLCFVLLLCAMICQCTGEPIWEYVIPLISATIGYMFGKGR